MFIQTQQTPNPNSLKFVTEKKVSLVGPIEFKDKSETSVSLIKNILSINGVTGIFLSDDYLSVNKDTNSEWEDLKHIIISYINDFYDQGNECIISEKRSENSEELSNVKNTIIKILETKVRPAVARDGGDIKFKDFKDYGWSPEKNVHRIYQGHGKETTKPVIISTWQSIYNLPKKWFRDVGMIIGDEAHLFKSMSLTKLMTKLEKTKYRVGLTGTLDGSKTNKLVLEGLFGPYEKITNTNELIKQGHLSRLKIKVLVLKHPHQKFESYQDEIEYLVTHERRNNFIKNLALDLSGNTLILFNYVEKHGEPLFDLINSSAKPGRKIFFVHGGVETEDRENVRDITERENNAIIVASYGTFSTGINIKNLHNVIFASPSKSRIRNLQSIGRVLRKGDRKLKATLYDIADDISYNKRKNYTLNHLIERIKIYNQENFNYDIVNIPLKN